MAIGHTPGGTGYVIPNDPNHPDVTPSDTVTLTLNGPAKPYRVCGVRFEFTPEDGLSQTLALRQLRP